MQQKGCFPLHEHEGSAQRSTEPRSVISCFLLSIFVSARARPMFKEKVGALLLSDVPSAVASPSCGTVPARHTLLSTDRCALVRENSDATKSAFGDLSMLHVP